MTVFFASLNALSNSSSIIRNTIQRSFFAQRPSLRHMTPTTLRAISNLIGPSTTSIANSSLAVQVAMLPWSSAARYMRLLVARVGTYRARSC